MIYQKNLTKIPFKFGKIEGHFNCNANDLTSLENCPDEVTDTFFCSTNNLQSLEFAPKRAKNFFCTDNRGKKFTEEDVRKYTNVEYKIELERKW